ncbi:MAG: hypothetical protein EON91_09730 [Brevundimonas sp.]|uniref:hypothetical protein n=1 Tax=Brevundimonas sp. TaxID=1871086 RepID=UPI0012134CF6|nr:hypothetical protein [Brevundimonas sp.]RZJ17327.1 MAG: hypothetical protein EON91_09730 [Brevundimonas sp.]
MLGRGLVNRLVAMAVAAGAAFVAVVALGATLYYALALVLTPLGAAAMTAALFVVLALVVCFVFLKRADGEDDEDEDHMGDGGLTTRALMLFRNRPILATTAALAGGWIFLRNPALATMVAAAFTEKSPSRKRR